MHHKRSVLIIGAAAVCAIGILFSSSIASGQSGQPALPKLFPGVQLGNVVMADGTIRDTQPFDYRILANWVAPKSLSVERKEVSGNSTYSKSEAGTATEVSGGVNIMDVVGISGFYNSSLANAEDFQGVRMEAKFIGSNRMARIGFADMNPEDLLESLSETLHDARRSPLQDLVEALEEFQELDLDLNDPAQVADAKDLILDMVEAKEEFSKDYGIGFVSGVVLGGAAVVQLDFAQQTESEEDKYEGGGELSVGLPQVAGKVSASHGEVNKSGFKEARFTVTSTAMGSEAYRTFADSYQQLFASKSMDKLWDTNILDAPSAASILGGSVPELPSLGKKPSKPTSKLIEKFGKIKSEDDVQLLNKIIAFEKWNAQQNGDGTWEEFNEWLATEGNLPDDDLPVEDELAENPDEQLVNNAGAPVGGGVSLGEEVPAEVPAQNAFNSEYLGKLQEDYAVIGVEITRWEDVIPGLGDVDALVTGVSEAGGLLQSARVLERLDRIAAMYAFASTCMTTSSAKTEQTRFLNFANIFRNHREALRTELQKLDRNHPDPLAVVKKYLSGMTEEARAVYNVFLENQAIFASSEVGMGGYLAGDFTKGSGLLRIGHFYRCSSAISGIQADRKDIWNVEATVAKNNPSDLHGPTLYAEATKFLPVLDPEIRNYRLVKGSEGQPILRYDAEVWLMASDPHVAQAMAKQGAAPTGSNASLMQAQTSYFGSMAKFFQKFPLKNFKATEKFGRPEIELSISADQFGYYLAYQNSKSNKDQYVLGRLLGGDSGEIKNVSDYLMKTAEEVSGGQFGPKTFHLVPFQADELKSVKWKGFIVYDQTTDDLINQFWQNVVSDLKPAVEGDNYWTKRFPRGRLNLRKNYSPTDLREFQSYFGLVQRPDGWN